jgi:hypothetical protein
MLVRYGLLTLIAFCAGVLIGRTVFSPPSSVFRFERNSVAFHACIAPYEAKTWRYKPSWDSQSERRALNVYEGLVACLNMSGIRGLSIGGVECASGYLVMSKKAYETGLASLGKNAKLTLPLIGSPCNPTTIQPSPLPMDAPSISSS